MTEMNINQTMLGPFKLNARYIKGNVTLKFDRYALDNSLALMLMRPDGQTAARATVYVRGSNLKEGEVLIKSWSENEGMAEELERLGIIGPVKRHVPTGHVQATVHNLEDLRR